MLKKHRSSTIEKLGARRSYIERLGTRSSYNNRARRSFGRGKNTRVA
jgi:hypothetical protein